VEPPRHDGEERGLDGGACAASPAAQRTRRPRAFLFRCYARRLQLMRIAGLLMVGQRARTHNTRARCEGVDPLHGPREEGMSSRAGRGAARSKRSAAVGKEDASAGFTKRQRTVNTKYEGWAT